MTKGRHGRLSEHAGGNESERRAGLETGNAEADPPLKRGRLAAVGKRATRAPTGSAGVLAAACVQEGDSSNTGSPDGGAHAPTGNPRGPAWAGGVAERPVVPEKPGNAGRGKGLGSRRVQQGGRDMETGGSLAAPDSVRKLQTTLHAKAKGFPDFRFYSLSDKVWRADVLDAAWRAVRRNGGAAGVDGETVQHIEQRGIERWLGELARDLKEGTYRPGAVRQVLIPKKQAGKVRPLGIPCVRDRVAQTAALLVLTPIFEADLEPEQYAYREGRSAQDAVKRVHRLLNTGHREVVDADMSNYFGRYRTLNWCRAWPAA